MWFPHKHKQRVTGATSGRAVQQHKVPAASSTRRTVRAQSSSLMYGTGNTAANQYQRYIPVQDRLEEGSIIESWIPTDLPGINKMFRQIYLRDGIAGPAIDVWSLIPWSTWDIIGIEDPHIRRFYEDALLPLFTAETMEEISKEFMSLGRFCASLVFNMTKGYWQSMLPHDSDFLDIIPIPMKGWDPIIDLRPGPGLRQFIQSPDARARAAMKELPPSLIQRIRAGNVQLDPFNTLWVARKISPYDHVGTSAMSRILPFWAIEKPLLDATVAAVRRRAGAILHVVAGLDDKWEPTEEEMGNLVDLFIRADEDPVGAVVVTRTGVESNEVRGPGSNWKLSDEFSFLSDGKMRAMGINDAFLSGEATYTSYEQATSIFMEQVRTFRERLTIKTILKLAEILARVHGFRKIKQSHLDHKIRIKPPQNTEQPIEPRDEEVRVPDVDVEDERERTEEKPTRREREEEFKLKNLSLKEAMAIPKSELIIPGVAWAKSLRPEGDAQLFEILTTMEEHGVPVSLREWAQAGGRSMDEVMEGLEDDAQLRVRINEWRKKVKPPEDEGFASVVASTTHPKQLPFWKNGRFISLRYKEFVKASEDLTSKPGILTDPRAVMAHLQQYLKSEIKAELAGYLLMRLGISCVLPVSARTSEAIFSWLRKIETPKETTMREFLVYSKLTHPEVYTNRAKADQKMRASFVKNTVVPQLATSVRKEYANIRTNSPNLMAGLG